MNDHKECFRPLPLEEGSHQVQVLYYKGALGTSRRWEVKRTCTPRGTIAMFGVLFHSNAAILDLSHLQMLAPTSPAVRPDSTRSEIVAGTFTVTSSPSSPPAA